MDVLQKLKMNPSKTEFSVVSSRHQVAKYTVTSINVFGEEITRSYQIKYLGTWLDHHLTYNDHITNKWKTVMLNQIKLIRSYIDQDACINVLLGNVSAGL